MTATSAPVRGLRALFGLVALYAVIGQLVLSSTTVTGFSPANYFSFFTIESNVIVGVALLLLAARPDRDGRWDTARGAVVLYIVITGLVYNALLRGTPVDVTNELYNELLHVVTPVAALLDWVLVAPLRPVGRARSLVFLVYPLAYAVYTLVRGPLVDWYPYPFLDPRLGGGYGRVALYLVVLTVVMVLLALGVAELGRLAARWWRRPVGGPPATAPGASP